jgi:hypothetical protein
MWEEQRKYERIRLCWSSSENLCLTGKNNRNLGEDLSPEDRRL